MTDITSAPAAPQGTRKVDWTSPEIGKRVKTRNGSEARLKYIGLAAIGFAFAMLATLIGSLVLTGRHAFTQTHVTLDVTFSEEFINPDNLARSNYRGLMQASVAASLPGLAEDEQRIATAILSNAAQFVARDRIVADPSLIGRTITLNVPTSDPYDQLAKGLIDRSTPEEFRRLKDNEIAIFDRMVEAGRVSNPLNTALFNNADSRFPELAGLRGAIIGSFWALLTCFVLSFPIGIGAAIYLEEFAPKNRISDFIEVNINNLAAVPSVVFGLLGLAVFIGAFGMGRSVPLVGGMVLALMTLPTIIIATRAALKAVPPSIREAALGIGASKQQVVFQHVLPLAMPGILTGTIIGLAQALGETAPLLLVGMNAFVTAAPATPFDPSTALPTQIFIWADSPERGFTSRTSAAILVLLGFLILMNAVAIYLRNRFERKW
ncbi:MAG: phosphate ABC transporter permease PstA [Paracoccaceae bacterium]|nr:MAG: phosphate ABC transporter permease PstA [Paracoccaceae bacterium]